MMKLTLMKRFFDTVDDEWRSPIAEEIAERWLEGEGTVRILRASANFMSVIRSGERRYFLRFNHSSERTPEYIKEELNYIRHLIGKGIKANRPIASRSGRLVESVSTEMGVFHAVLFEAMPGRHMEFEELDLKGLWSWGKAMGEVHAASIGYVGHMVPSWRDNIAFTRRILPESEATVLGELDSVEEKLRTLPVSEDNFGVIHYDFELDNLLWDGDAVNVIDFDDFARYWYVADFACALQDLFKDTGGRVDEGDDRFIAFLEGYRSVKPVSDYEISHIPLFTRLDHIYVYAKLYRSIEDGPKGVERSWTTDLREKLRKVKESYLKEILHDPM